MTELSVCPSARLSVERVNFDKNKETHARIFIPYESTMHLVLYATRRMVGGEVSFYLKFWNKLTHPVQKRRFLIYIRWYSASTVTSSEKRFSYDYKEVHYMLSSETKMSSVRCP